MRLTIDDITVEAQAGETILGVARRAGIDIPTLCHLDGFAPQASCFLCVVQVAGQDRFVPACATPAAAGMAVSTRSPEIIATRRMALELLLSDHAGQCVANCAVACPADLDIPGFTAPLAAGRAAEALGVVRRRLALPAVLGRICPAYCESACQRKRLDSTLSIRALHGQLAEQDLASGHPTAVACAPPTGKRVAIVGAGPAGLAAAFHLRQLGHACDLYDAAMQPGGLLRHPEMLEKIGAELLDAEIGFILGLGVNFHPGWRLGVDGSLDDLLRDHDSVLLACGASPANLAPERAGETRQIDPEFVKTLGLESTRKGLAADRRTLATSRSGVFAAGIFAAGEAVTGASHAVYAVAAGRAASAAIDQFLAGALPAGEPRPFYWRSRPLEGEWDNLTGQTPAPAPALRDLAHPTAEAIEGESRRCLQCGCAKANDCRLRRYAAEYGAQAGRYKGERRLLAPDDSHPEIIYEPGKCILCGLCVKLAEGAGEELGLCFAGRGFPTTVTVPLSGSLTDGLRHAARACAEACPSGALRLKSK